MSATFDGDNNYGGPVTSPQTNNFTITDNGVTVNVTSVNPATEIYGSLTPTLVTAHLGLDGRRDGADGRPDFGTNAPRIPGVDGAPNCSSGSSPNHMHGDVYADGYRRCGHVHDGGDL